MLLRGLLILFHIPVVQEDRVLQKISEFQHTDTTKGISGTEHDIERSLLPPS